MQILSFLKYFKLLISIVIVILFSISIHEFSHAFVSYRLGDPTPKKEGRLTLNPFVHIDPKGVLCLLLFRIGWTKPVNINPFYYKKRKQGIIAVSLAGPFANYIIAFLSLLVCGYFYKNNIKIYTLFHYIAQINVD